MKQPQMIMQISTRSDSDKIIAVLFIWIRNNYIFFLVDLKKIYTDIELELYVEINAVIEIILESCVPNRETYVYKLTIKTIHWMKNKNLGSLRTTDLLCYKYKFNTSHSKRKLNLKRCHNKK